MKIISTIGLLLAFAFAEAPAENLIDFSIRDFGSREFMQKQVFLAFKNYGAAVRRVRDGIKISIDDLPVERKPMLGASLASLDAAIERQDTSSIGELLPLLDYLHANNTDESPQIIQGLSNSQARISLNYFIDCVFSAEMTGAPDAVGESKLAAMIRFYAGNPSQTSEGTWQTANTMLFVFGDRVLNTLAKKTPDRIDAFYKAVLDARKTAQSGPGPDEEAIPDTERPTAEQLQNYEASFGKLEELATKGPVPKFDPTSQPTPTHASFVPPTVPAVPLSQTKAPSTKPAPALPNEEPSSTTPWGIIVVLLVAAIGLLWLLLKRRAR
jgi:hypothetical protein